MIKIGKWKWDDFTYECVEAKIFTKQNSVESYKKNESQLIHVCFPYVKTA